MTRLTNAIRDAIRAELLAHRFREPILILLNEAQQLGEDVYAELYPPHVYSKMNALPEGFFRKQDHIKTFCLGQPLHIYFGPFIEYLKGYEAIPREQRHVQSRIMGQRHYPEYSNILTLSDPLQKRVEQLIQNRDKHNAAYSTASTQLEASLAAVGSISNLIKAWPEIEPFAKKYMDPVKIQLPAIPVASLNAMLDLSTDKVA